MINNNNNNNNNNNDISTPRLRRTVADRKRLLTKVIEGLGQHGMVRSMVVVVRATMKMTMMVAMMMDILPNR